MKATAVTSFDPNATYWNSDGKLQVESEILSELIPSTGEAEIDVLNLVRTMNNLYYDLYNNGLCNLDIRFPEFQKYALQFKDTLRKYLKLPEDLDTILDLEDYINSRSHYFEREIEKPYAEFERVNDAIIEFAYNVSNPAFKKIFVVVTKDMKAHFVRGNDEDGARNNFVTGYRLYQVTDILLLTSL